MESGRGDLMPMTVITGRTEQHRGDKGPTRKVMTKPAESLF
jgi:hypothetical protein